MKNEKKNRFVGNRQEMNIFFLHMNPRICAQMHVDKHVIKMILETCQLLCSAVHLNGTYTPPYKLTHKNHPSSLWTRKSLNNYNWLCELGIELCKEYTYRYGKIHKTQKHIEFLKKNPPLLPDDQFTLPPAVMPENYKKNDVVFSYRYYILYEKTDLLSWSGKIAGRQTPEWVKQITNIL